MYFGKNILESLSIVWGWLSAWKKIAVFIMNELIVFLIENTFSYATFWRGFLYTILVYLGIALFYAIFIRPYKIISEQESTILLFKGKVKKESFIEALIMQREIGVELRNKGDSILHESQIEPWWNEHLKWRTDTEELIALLDNNKALQWSTLGDAPPSKIKHTPFNPDVSHKLQMFDEWLVRLHRLINEFSS